MKRAKWLLICISLLLLASAVPLAGSLADGDHPITLSVLCDPDPELETDGTIPGLLFTIRNNGSEDYVLEHAQLSGGYEDRLLVLDEQEITVLAGGTKEFRLTDIPISDAQLGVSVTYVLSWTETEWVTDTETETKTAVTHNRETSAQICIERFVPPELSVTATASAERVRAGETFTVLYTITNDTKFDMSGLKLYDPEQSMQSIGLPSAELFAGESKSVEVTYTMGKKDMLFSPVIEYTVRQREQMTHAETKLTVESVVVNLTIEVQQYPATAEGSEFAITVRNAGNRTVTNVQVFDEINTQIEDAFDLAPEQSKVLMYTVPSAISSGTIRKIRFHLTAVDSLGTGFSLSDSNQYEAVPFVDADSIKLGLYVVMQHAYYDENGKLCGTIQFEIRNFSSVALHNAKLTELRLFGELKNYPDLQNGVTYYQKSLQLDGVQELTFRVDAYDPAEQRCSSETILLDLTRLRELADQTDEPVYVYPNNPYFNDLDVKYRGILRTAGLIVLIVAAVCAIVCIALYAVERKIRAKLPAQFEENMESAIQKAKRKAEPQIFGDAPTEQFGYTVPIKLRNYGELSEQEAEQRKKEYEKKLRENLREYSASPAAISAKRTEKQDAKPTDAAFAGTRIIPVARPGTEAPVRGDIRLISVNPAEPDFKREPAEPEAKPQKQPAKQPRAKEPAQKPQKKQGQGKPAAPKPEPRKPEARPGPQSAAIQKPEPRKPEVKPEPRKPEARPEPQSAAIQKPEPRKPEVKPEPRKPEARPELQSVAIPKPEWQKETVREPMPTKETAEDRTAPTQTALPIEPQPVLSTTAPTQTDETRAPRLLWGIEPPKRRPITEQTIKRMNG